MRFYNRTDELAEFATLYEQSADNGRMTPPLFYKFQSRSALTLARASSTIISGAASITFPLRCLKSNIRI